MFRGLRTRDGRLDPPPLLHSLQFHRSTISESEFRGVPVEQDVQLLICSCVVCKRLFTSLAVHFVIHRKVKIKGEAVGWKKDFFLSSFNLLTLQREN